MRIVACAFTRLPGPVEEGVIRFDNVTALVGSNDSGKSRLLDVVVGALAGDNEVSAMPSSHGLPPSVAVYAKVDDKEFEWLTTRGLSSLAVESRAVVELVRPGHRRRRVEPGMGPSKVSALSAEVRSDLLASRLVAFCRGTSTYWRTWLCVAKEPEPPNDRSVLQQIGNLPPRLLYEFGKTVATSDFPICLLHPDAPLAVVELAGAGEGALPEPVRVPTAPSVLIDELALGVDEILGRLTWVESASNELDFDGADGWSVAEFETAWADVRDSHDAWLSNPPTRGDLWFTTTESGRVLRRRRELDRLVARASRVATYALPSFIADRYAITISLPSASDWREAAPLNIELRSWDGGMSFRLDAASDGVQLWIQLALLEAIRDLRRWPSTAEALIDSFQWGIEQMAELAAEIDDAQAELAKLDPDDDPDDYADAEDYRYMASEGLDELRLSLSIFPEGLRSAVREALKLPRARRRIAAAPSLDRPRSLRPPLYVLDEPERHLHPRLQRAAAKWLQTLTKKDDLQVLLVTHAVPFTRLQRQASVYVQRTGTASTVQNLVPEQLTAINEITRELGLDRGELLTSTSLLLFVEGESDRMVLESLFGDRLRAAGVEVVPMGGVTKSGGVLDTELLLRWSSAQVCVMFDDLAQTELDELVALDDDTLRKASRKGKTERQYMARLIGKARQLNRPLHIEGIPVHDIFDLLTDAALRAVFPKWPGHTQARADQKRAGKGLHPKEFRERAYGIPKHDVFWYAQVADLMRRQPPRELERVVRAAETHAAAGQL
jgi:ABC-type branched-subunit amino acid transport system ATPase component